MRALISVFDKTGVVELSPRDSSSWTSSCTRPGGTEALLQESEIPVKGVQELTRVSAAGSDAPPVDLRRDPRCARTATPKSSSGSAPRRSTSWSPTSTRSARPRGDPARLDPGRPSTSTSAVSPCSAPRRRTSPTWSPSATPATIRRCSTSCAREAGWAEIRRRLAAKAFQHCAVYDTQIAGYLRTADELFPDQLTVAMTKIAELRYGENPHQLAAFYADSNTKPLPRGVVSARQLHGKQLSFNNTYDLDAAWRIVADFSAPTVAIVKHGNPCGLSYGDDLAETYRRALSADPQSAFGGAIGINPGGGRGDRPRDLPGVLRGHHRLGLRARSAGVADAPRPPRHGRGFQPERPGRDGERRHRLQARRGRLARPDARALAKNMLTRDVVTATDPLRADQPALRLAGGQARPFQRRRTRQGAPPRRCRRRPSQPRRRGRHRLPQADDRAPGSVMASDAFFPFPTASSGPPMPAFFSSWPAARSVIRKRSRSPTAITWR